MSFDRDKLILAGARELWLYENSEKEDPPPLVPGDTYHQEAEPVVDAILANANTRLLAQAAQRAGDLEAAQSVLSSRVRTAIMYVSAAPGDDWDPED